MQNAPSSLVAILALIGAGTVLYWLYNLSFSAWIGLILLAIPIIWVIQHRSEQELKEAEKRRLEEFERTLEEDDRRLR